LAAPACNRPLFRERRDQTALGAANGIQVANLQACQNLCVTNANCVGVDFDVNPLLCWLHYAPNAYVESNIYSQPGTNSYQLLTRCAPTGCLFLSLSLHFFQTEIILNYFTN